MNAIKDVILELHRAETVLADELLAVGDRQHAEHEIRHVVRDLERWSREHLLRLADFATRYGHQLHPAPRETLRGLTDIGDETTDKIVRRPEPGLLVLRDLRTLHLMATENFLYWQMLAQAAQARRDDALLELVHGCQPQTVRQIRWAETQLKSMSPQILTSLTSP